jgi:tRNA(Arg) A34 adenosine deaminase TadA
MASLSAADQDFLRRAIDISRHALKDQGKTPFGALVVVGGEIAGEGTSSVVELLDPSAHAEIMALRRRQRRRSALRGSRGARRAGSVTAGRSERWCGSHHMPSCRRRQSRLRSREPAATISACWTRTSCWMRVPARG